MPDRRRGRGRLLAHEQGQRIKQVDGPIWFVPSSRAGGYLVNVETATCSCPDAERGTKCKHRWAVEYAQGNQTETGNAPVIASPAPVKAPSPRGDLTGQEQANVRAALRFLRVRSGGWDALAKGARFAVNSLRHVAVRLARFAGVPVDDVLAGRYPPPGACPHCGRGPE